MSVIGFNLKSIKAHVNQENVTGDVNVNSAPNIVSVEKRNLAFLGVKEALGIKFEFTTSYEPNVGEIGFTGEILYQVENAKDLMDSWKKEGKLDEKIALDVLNTIFRKCLAKSVEVADTLLLPPPIRFPVVTTEKPVVKKKGK